MLKVLNFLKDIFVSNQIIVNSQQESKKERISIMELVGVGKSIYSLQASLNKHVFYSFIN
ncbi:MAG: hypothetical protein K0B10_07680 [Vicingaceae bacterium]|nr:hypothetical protein [Vicingaceae bacterium]